ncbi:MAG: hypothetical protein AB8I08_09950 [Sandaracinaceae bacterium]
MTLNDFLKKSSRFALAAGLAGAVGFAAPVAVSFAQDTGADASAEECEHRGRRGHRGHMRRMAQELELTEAQRTEIRGIMQEARANRGERGDRAARGAVRERIQAVLTPEQRTRAAELRQTHSRERVDRRVARMTEHLSLSDTQASQVSGILRNAAMQRRALREQAQNDPGSARDAMQSLRESTRASVRSVLNAEQTAQLEEMHSRRGERGHHGRRGHGGPRGGGGHGGR